MLAALSMCGVAVLIQSDIVRGETDDHHLVYVEVGEFGEVRDQDDERRRVASGTIQIHACGVEEWCGDTMWTLDDLDIFLSVDNLDGTLEDFVFQLKKEIWD